MAVQSNEKIPKLGPYAPTLILHGGAGSISRSNLPPDLYHQYKTSLLKYLRCTHNHLRTGHSALDAACYAVSLMEDDELFNCGKGSVFTEKGTNEMEASVMVCSLHDDGVITQPGGVKRGAAVSLIKETRHPIMLAREVLLDAGDGFRGTSHMHCHLSGSDVEEWGWKERKLERKEAGWFWTKRRWDEHLRGLQRRQKISEASRITQALTDEHELDCELPSQGTVGAVCMDSWGNLAVATSTGGLTNKKAGRIGDTPTLGAGFWAESWDEEGHDVAEKPPTRPTWASHLTGSLQAWYENLTRDCYPEGPSIVTTDKPKARTRRAVAMSGTGNGDSFLRVDAVRTVAARCRFVNEPLARAVTAVAGPKGELQLSAGNRWRKTGEVEGGIIGIELCSSSRTCKPVFDFNCGGLWRAWIDDKTGHERVMVFREEYPEL